MGLFPHLPWSTLASYERWPLSPTARRQPFRVSVTRDGRVFEADLREPSARKLAGQLSAERLAELTAALAGFLREPPAQEIHPVADGTPTPTCRGTRHVVRVPSGWFKSHTVNVLDWWDWAKQGRPRWLELLSDVADGRYA